MPNDNTHTLLPCRWCNAKPQDLEIVGAYSAKPEWPFAVHCTSCGAHGPTGDTPEDAASEWNTRTPAEPKAGDWEKELERESRTRQEVAKSAISPWFVPTGKAKQILRRALSSAAPRITERKWISVDERLPHAGEPLWIDCGNEKPMMGTWLAVQKPNLYLNCHTIGRGFWSWGHDDEMVLIKGITRWAERIVDTPPPFTPTSHQVTSEATQTEE